ncbi:hypothetical protein R6Q59_017164 [Mikania micrantha]
MASTYPTDGATAEKNGVPHEKPLSLGTKMLDKGAEMLQSLKPIKQMSQHTCTFALYSQDMSRQIETHHFVTRINQDFLQCAVYDSDDTSGRLIGVEYIVSDRIFDTLQPDEQKLWHSHAYEIQSGLLVHPRIPEAVAKPELENLAKTYGKFWCTWQTDRGDKLPIGPPSLMMSPQCMVKEELVKKREDKYNMSTTAIRGSRTDIMGPDRLNAMADYWREHKKCLGIEVESTEMKKMTMFP